MTSRHNRTLKISRSPEQLCRNRKQGRHGACWEGQTAEHRSFARAQSIILSAAFSRRGNSIVTAACRHGGVWTWTTKVGVCNRVLLTGRWN